MSNNIKRPLVSVIIPSFNHERYIEDSIRSVWSQSYPNIELVVVDDGSSDASVEIIKSLELISPIPMTTLFKENEGLCKTLNRGLGISRGDYLAILASDDRYLPNKLTDLIPNFSDDEIGMVFSDGFLIDLKGNRIGKISRNYHLRGGDIFEDLLLCNFMIHYSTVIYPKFVIDKVGSFNENHIFEDWDLFLRISKQFKCVYVENTVSEYRIGGNESMNRNVEKLVPSILNIFTNHMESYHKANNRFWKRFALSKIYLRLGESFYIVSDFKTARSWFIKSLASNPFQVKSYNLFLRSLLGKTIIEKLRKRAS